MRRLALYCRSMFGWLALGLYAVSATAQGVDKTVEQVRNDMYAALSNPLPITVVGPLMASDIQIEKRDDHYQVVMEQTRIMGFFPFGRVSLQLQVLDEDRYRVSSVSWPSSVDAPDNTKVILALKEFEGVWSVRDRSYEQLQMFFDTLGIASAGSGPALAELDDLRISVMKQKGAQNNQSHISLSAGALHSEGLGADELTATLTTTGKEPLDLYGFLSRFILHAAMQPDSSAMSKLFASVTSKTYSAVEIDLRAKALHLSAPFSADKERVTLGSAQVNLSLSEVSPEKWAQAVLTLSMQDYAFHSPDLAEATYQVARSHNTVFAQHIPVGKIIAAFRALEALNRYESAEANLGQVLAALLDFDRLTISNELNEALIRVPDHDTWSDQSKQYEASHEHRLEHWSSELGWRDFLSAQAQIVFNTDVQGLDIFDLIVTDVADDEELNLRLARVLPVKMRYDLRLFDLQLDLLRRLASGVTLTNLDNGLSEAWPALSLYAMALKPTLVGEKFHYQTKEFDVFAGSKLTYIPAQMLSRMFPFEGDGYVRIENIDAFENVLSQLSQEVGAEIFDDEERRIQRALGQTLLGISVREENRAQWNYRVDEIADMKININDITFHYPGILTSMLFGIYYW